MWLREWPEPGERRPRAQVSPILWPWALVGPREAYCCNGNVRKRSSSVRTELKVSGCTHFYLGSRKSEVTEKVSKAARGEGAGVHLEQGDREVTAKAFRGGGYTHTACIGDLPGLLSLSLLLVCSIAPFSSSRMALARLPRVGFPMEAVVYRGILFSAIEACHQPREDL